MDPKLILLPLGLVCWFLPFPLAAVISRVLLLLSVSGGLARLTLLRRVEMRWAALLGLYLAASVTSALFSVDRSASLVDFGRQAYVVVFSLLLVLATRGTNERGILAAGMILPTLLGMAVVVYLYWKFGSGFSNDALHTFKASVSDSVPRAAMNPIGGFVVLAFFATVPAISRFRHSSWIVAAMLVPVLAATGARSTIVALALALLMFWTFRIFARLALFPRLVVVALALSSAVVVGIRMPASAVDNLNVLVTNRVYLWQAAWERFGGHQWFGAGADTWRLDLAAVLPAGSRGMSEGILQLSSGAYHNGYLAFLAERGLMVCIPALLVLWFVMGSAFRVYAHRELFGPGDRRFAALAPIIVLFILIRQFAECSGLLGYANGAVDFASFVVASLVIALAGNIGHVAPALTSVERQAVTLKAATVGDSE